MTQNHEPAATHVQLQRLHFGDTDLRLDYTFTALGPDDALTSGDLDQGQGREYIDTYFDTTRHGGRSCGAVECYTVLAARQPQTLHGRVQVDALLDHLAAGHDLFIVRGEAQDGAIVIHEVRLVISDGARRAQTMNLLTRRNPALQRRIDDLLSRSLSALHDLN